MKNHLEELTEKRVTLIPVQEFTTYIREAIRQEIREKQKDEFEERLLSPNEARKLFQPQVSIGTLDNWASEGLIKKHYMGRLTYYKYSEIMASLKTIKRYQRRIAA